MPKTIKYIIILLLVAIAPLSSIEASKVLTFVKTDGSMVAFTTEGLKITYDNYAHAIVTNNETSATLDLAELQYMYFGEEGTIVIIGVVNGDAEVTVADINVIINVILGYDTNSHADVNGDGEVTIADINVIINLIMAS